MGKKQQEEEEEQAMYPMCAPYMYPPMMPFNMPQDPKLQRKLEEVIRKFDEENKKKKLLKKRKKQVRSGLSILEAALLIYVATWPLAFAQQYLQHYFQTLINGLN